MQYTQELMSLGPQWTQAWANEVGPVLEDLGTLDRWCVTAERDRTGVPTAPTRQWLLQCVQGLQALGQQLGARQVTPVGALQALDQTAHQLRVQADWLGQAVTQLYRADTSARTAQMLESYRSAYWAGRSTTTRYTGRWSLRGSSGRYRPERTVRVNPNHPPAEVAAFQGVCAPLTALGQAFYVQEAQEDYYQRGDSPLEALLGVGLDLLGASGSSR